MALRVKKQAIEGKKPRLWKRSAGPHKPEQEKERMKEHWCWPFKGGTWKERLIGLIDVVEIVLLAALLYGLAWVLAPYF